MLRKISRYAKSWFSSGNNIFQSDTGDALWYLLLYIAVPIFITVTDLLNFPTNDAAAAYPYTCIIISAANCLYDIKNRWDNDAASVQNTKLFIMGFATLIVAGYAAFEMFLILGKQNLNVRCDEILCVYFVACAVSLIDIACCFGTRLTMIDHADTIDEEVIME